MKLTKQDYMRLPKERLAELLVENESQKIELVPTPASVWGCDGVHCTNPNMDCINCPRKATGGTITSPNTATGISILKAEGK